MAEFLAEAEFLEKRQSAKIQEEKLKIEEEYTKLRNNYVRGSSEDNSSKCKMYNLWHDLDECKVFNDMTAKEKSKFLTKQKLCYGYYEVISPKHTTRNCPTRLHGYKIRRKGDSKDDDDSGKNVKNNCANIKDVYSVNQLELEKFLSCV